MRRKCRNASRMMSVLTLLEPACFSRSQTPHSMEVNCPERARKAAQPIYCEITIWECAFSVMVLWKSEVRPKA